MSKGSSKTTEDTHESREQGRARSLRTLVLVYLPPWVGWLLSWPLAALFYLLWGGHPGLPAATYGMFIVTVTVGMVAMVDHLAKNRGKVVRHLARWSVIPGGLWMALAGMYGPWSGIIWPWLKGRRLGPMAHAPLLQVWMIGGVILCLFWMFRRALLTSKGEVGHIADATGRLLEVLDGARLSNVHEQRTKMGKIIRFRAEVDRGHQSPKDLAKQAEHIEAIGGLRPDAVTLTQDPKDRGMLDGVIIPEDTLDRDDILFEPDHPGESIALPIRVGPYDDGELLSFHVPGDERGKRNLAHVLDNSITGGGKTGRALNIMTKIGCRTEVCILACDPVKGLQTLKPFVEANALELYSLDVRGGRAMLAAILRSIAARAKYLGERGYPQWAPGCGLTLLAVWLEEADWATQSAILEKIVKQARSVGIWIFASQQRSSYTKTDTDLRSQFAAGISGGLADAADAKFNLPDEVVDVVGDMLERWGASKPGYMVMVHPSIAPERWVRAARSEFIDAATCKAELMKWSHVRSTMDPVTRAAFGETYEQLKRTMAGEDPAQVWKRKPGQDVADAGEDGELLDDNEDFAEPGDDDPIAEADAEEANDLQSDDGGMPPLGDPVEPDMHVNLDQPVEPAPADIADVPIGEPDPPRRLDAAEAREVVQRHLRAIVAQGRDTVTVTDIVAMKPPTTRSREWVRQELIRLTGDVGAGELGLERVEDEDGMVQYRILVPVIAGAVEDGHDQ